MSNYTFCPGYIVSLSSKVVSHIECMRIIIQSNRADPVFLEARAEAFLQKYRAEELETMTNEFLAANVTAVIENLLEPPKNLDKVYLAMFGYCCRNSIVLL